MEDKVDWRFQRLLSGIVIVTVVVGLGWVLFCVTGFQVSRVYEPWMGIRLSGDGANNVGDYRSLDTCRKTVEKTGGWCGKACKSYGGGLIADCDPLIEIPENNSK